MATPPDLAHIHHAELLTTKPDESLRFFVDVLGMEVEAQAAGSVYLRGWGDYAALQPEADRGGVDRARAPGDPGVEPGGARPASSAAIEATGRGLGWIDGDHGHGPAYRFTRPRRARVRALYEAERYEPPPELAPVPEEPAAALRRPRSRASSGSTTSTCSPPTSAPAASSPSTSSATGSTSAWSSTTAPRRAPG